MSTRDLDKAYVSRYDKFLVDFDKHHDKTPSQLAEIKKHKRIATLRDTAEEQSPDKLWESF